MKDLTLKDLCVPLIKSIDSFNYLLKSHHRRTAVIAYQIAKKMGIEGKELSNLVIAAAMHDIGALTVQERDTLIQEDVDNPSPHCIMGYRMLSTFDVFSEVAQIIRYHHIVYEDRDKMKTEVLFQSYIIHLADRVDILIKPDVFVLSQKKDVIDKIVKKSGTIFHPEVVDAFIQASKADVFWIEINNMTMEALFNKIEFDIRYEMDIDQVILFSQTISRIVDFRSKFTVSHSFTVAHLSYHIAKMIGLEQEHCNKLLIAGFFHDIGKIGIDTGILEKNGKLTEAERDLVKLHSYYTNQILTSLSTSDWFKDVIRWASHHHERTDGSGYPYALEEDNFDIGIIILAYSDIISALSENRPYRTRLPIEVVLDIIQKEFNSVLDEKVFDVIKDNKDKIDDIINTCQNETQLLYESHIKY